ncbi:MAG: amidohydrolase family protein [Myxococcaceae bacterium]|nr:amidohydrolase family protein [Myxococcaceae bacterium]
MEGRLLFKDCTLLTADGRVREGMAVLVEGATIRRVAADVELPALPGDWAVPCRGRVLAPGLIDCHTHLVGGQLLPRSAGLLVHGVRAVMERTHRMEAALSAGEVEALTAQALAHALLDGVTLAVDHLHAPGSPAAALEAQARVARTLGMRVVLSHATHTHAGEGPALAQLESSAEFAAGTRRDALVRGALGFHASADAEDALLERLGRLREEVGASVIFHLAESEEDLTGTFARHGRRVVPRLDTFGLLGPFAVAAGARAVDRSECEELARSRTLVAISPAESRLAEPTGGARLETFVAHQTRLGLGTSGTSSLRDELEAALGEVLVASRAGRLHEPDSVLTRMLLTGPAELCSSLFGLPAGEVREGALADLVVFEWVPAALPGGSAGGLPVRGLCRARAAWTVVGGRVVVREGQLVGQDAVVLGQEAARALRSVWARTAVGEAAD